MRKRLVKKIVKKYGNSWWATTFKDKLFNMTWYLNPPSKWNTPKILKYYHIFHYTNNMYLYKIFM
jgi:hypothetical protein